MMMPANYSVIAENEMTYVNGGALIDCFAPMMNEGNWKTFNTNLIYVIGNSAMSKFLASTVGVIFGGDFGFEKWGNTLETNYYVEGNAFDTVANVLGGLAAIYTLGNGSVKTLHANTILGVDGAAVKA